MTKKHLFISLILLDIANTLTIIIAALIGHNNYTIASNFGEYFDYVLYAIPLCLTSIALIWWILDNYLNTEYRPNYFALAFVGILADAVFVIGSILFTSGS